ncbi:putative RNA-directed DNA polymerase [Aphis craccivora]|uniref:Putative RNA-directed DNA polymerase n=1 Tax=Aphis craccivora TaxID=307492 RepID=A0A6G0ZCW9_APHCR|nr:putative RNA-directed DNA polymerase [Aphis craccivora]
MLLHRLECPRDHLSPLLFSLFVNNDSHVLHHSKLLCFANDMKIYMRINNQDDCDKLLSDLGHFVEYFNLLRLSLKIPKCKVMTFIRKQSPIVHSYNLIGTILLREDNNVIDLGFKFSSSLDPRAHIYMICSKTLKTLIILCPSETHFGIRFTNLGPAYGKWFLLARKSPTLFLTRLYSSLKVPKLSARTPINYMKNKSLRRIMSIANEDPSLLIYLLLYFGIAR